MQAAGYQVIARAFGRRRTEDRRLEFGEALVDHPAAQARDDPVAQHDVLVNPLAPKVDEAVLEADILWVFLLARDGQRQFLGRRLNCGGLGKDLDIAGRQVGVARFLRTCLHHAVDGDDALGLQRIQQGERLAVLVRHDLRDAVMVAQVDEQDTAMVALAVDPAGQANGLADIAFAKLCASMGAVGVHCGTFRFGD